jgi:hypothetical protein
VLATSLVNLFVDESALLKQMQVKPMAGKKQNVNVLDVPSRSATRLTSNTWPDSSTGTVPLNPSLMLDAEKMQFSWIIDDDTIMTYIGNMPGLENELTGSFTSALQNDILDLGLNGTGGTWSGSFVNLNKGWFQLAIGGPDSGTGGINAATPAGQVLDVSDERLHEPRRHARRDPCGGIQSVECKRALLRRFDPVPRRLVRLAALQDADEGSVSEFPDTACRTQ